VSPETPEQRDQAVAEEIFDRLPPPDHHRDVTGGPLRPAVFGAMDGLVSNFALIAGVAGSNVAAGTVALAGLAGLVSGALSMAVGEYTSVASQTELARAEIAVEKLELERNPREEENELAALYVQRGVEAPLAREIARQISANKDQAWRIHAREELGIDPDDLPSPWVAAISSFIFFTVGAAIPLLPYLLGAHGLTISLLLAGIGLFGAGAITSRFTNRSWWYAGLRQLVLGGLAAAVTYGIGRAVGTSGLG
jgi:vacuolar iron transporter family protein